MNFGGMLRVLAALAIFLIVFLVTAVCSNFLNEDEDIQYVAV